jgi:cell division protein ZapA (FtsZ GTPase activity inhibitor)
MEQKQRIITFNILGEEYKVKTDLDKDTAVHIASFVSRQIGDIAKKAGYASQTKIAVLAALNIAIELFQERNTAKQTKKKIEQMGSKLRAVLKDN